MFTGIIEEVGIVKKIKKENQNLRLDIAVSFLDDIQINQSISHNGACLTVVKLSKESYSVDVVTETIQKTNVKSLKEGDAINIERCLSIGNRLDGHFVQGHVDCVAKCISIIDLNGSWLFQFKYPEKHKNYIVTKGSITINGVSLTISNIDDLKNTFEVNIIPYSFKHTNFSSIKVNDFVNIEFDILGKYIERLKNNIK
tara:strand:- start:1217 stop:1813 length:597 start_codon:yes stop_codon:yes gene_type:complete